MMATHSMPLDEADADLMIDSYHQRDRAALQRPFHYPTQGWRLLVWNAGVAALGLAGTLFVLATCI